MKRNEDLWQLVLVVALYNGNSIGMATIAADEACEEHAKRFMDKVEKTQAENDNEYL